MRQDAGPSHEFQTVPAMTPTSSRSGPRGTPRASKQRAGTRILVMAVSQRLDSVNRKLARLAEETARGMWVDATLVDTADYPLPMCDCDPGTQKEAPPNAVRLNRMLKEHQGMIIVTPERNRSVPAVLKNALEWVAASVLNPDAAYPFKNKPVMLMSAGEAGTDSFHCMSHLRDILGDMKMHVLPETLTLTDAGKAFGRAGKIKDAALPERVATMVEELIVLTERLRA